MTSINTHDGAILEALNNKADSDLNNAAPSRVFTAQSALWNMPSSEYVDLTLNASDSDYIAPANGYYCIYKTAGASQSAGYIVFENKTTGAKSISTPTTANSAGILFPIRKNDVLNIRYTVTGTTKLFRFYYAQGEIS